MRIVLALGVIAGGFLVSSPPKAVITTMLWAVSRSLPALGTAALLSLVLVWRERKTELAVVLCIA